jgi:hypothetical protein
MKKVAGSFYTTVQQQEILVLCESHTRHQYGLKRAERTEMPTTIKCKKQSIVEFVHQRRLAPLWEQLEEAKEAIRRKRGI